MSTARKQVALVITVVTTVVTVAIATAVVKRCNRKERNRRRAQQILRKFARDCATPVSRLWKVVDALVHDMEASLAGGGSSREAATTLNMLVSYAPSLPNGDEKGMYYGVNVRGSNFLILCAKLGGKNEPVSDLYRQDISIPSNVLAGNPQELCDYIALELARFVSAHPPSDEAGAQGTEKKLGFTISFLKGQDTATGTSCSPIKWKSFSADDSVRKALTNDFNLTLERCGLDMRVFAPVDDTTAQLAGGRYYSKDVVAAVRLSLTINAAYLEPADSVAILNSPSSDYSELVINTEWGSFNSCHLPVTEFDASLDAESSSPGRQIFEKLISATYLGEIVRRVLLKIAQETSLFGDAVPSKLAIPFLLKTPDMAAMHQDTSEDHTAVAQKLEEIFGITNSTLMAREIVVEVCDIVAERGARLAGAGIVAIVQKLGRIEHRRSVVTVEGGLYDHYRVFRNYLHSSIWEMLGDDLSDNVILEHSHGGPGAGSLFLAASQTCNPGSYSLDLPKILKG